MGKALGPYRIAYRLGAGATGVVFRAEEIATGRAVALKVLSESLGTIGALRGRFEREARLLARLDHPNIVHIAGFGVAEQSTYIAMELLEGRTLEQALADGPIDPARGLEVVKELLAGLAMGSAFLVANRFRASDLRLATGWLWVTALGHAALGFWIYSILKVRTGSIYFTPIPGLVAVLLFNFALRARTTRLALLWVAAMLPLLMHQFLSFTRGYWLAILISLVFSMVVFAWRQPDAAVRWRRSGTLLAALAGLGVLGAIVLALVYGIRGLGELALSRFSSSVGTTYTFETSSNIVRLVEAAKVLSEILKAPLHGHGLGYAFTVREPIHLELIEQWYCHQNYLLVWLKQGLVGLVLFVGTLFAGLRTTLKGRALADPVAQSWCMGAAAATVYVIVYGLVHFPLAEVNTTFTIALLWGSSAALTTRDWHELRWGRPVPGDRA